MSAILVHGVQLTQFVKSLNDSDNKAVEMQVDVTPSQIINAFLFTVWPLEREKWYCLCLLLISLIRSQMKSISLRAVDLTSHHGLVPSTILLVQLKCLEADL